MTRKESAKEQPTTNADLNAQDRRVGARKEILRNNPAFTRYYKAQNICATEAEWIQFNAAIRENLPASFRVTGFKDEARALLNLVETKLFADYVKSVAELNGTELAEVERPQRLPWYRNGMAYQLQLTRKDIRRSETLYRLHNFLIVETSVGSVSRQETVSMIPPVVLDVKPTDKVLDMCAAPGSKTAQLLEALHAEPHNYKIPPGIVVANDVDTNRCYMLAHQAKRLDSPCLLVTNHDSACYPNLSTVDANEQPMLLKFDKVLCDVPCSGDGTLRKNLDIWAKWNLGQAYNLHGTQYRIARRGAELLEVGGRLVYSTCSLNPVENEAVVQRLIAEAQGALALVDVSALVPGLRYKHGLNTWRLATKYADTFFSSFDEVPSDLHTIIRPAMFPLSVEQLNSMGIEKCMRVLPHQQNTGGFFVAVIEKLRDLVVAGNIDDHAVQPTPMQKPNKRRQMYGYREDPYIFFEVDDRDWPELQSFYQLDERFNKRCLLTRCNTEKKKNIYFCSPAIRTLVLLNLPRIKIINTGVKAFARCETRHSNHPYRLSQEGLQTTNPFIGAGRRIELKKSDFILLLNCTDPTKPPSTYELHPATQAQCDQLCVGSCVIKYVDPSFTMYVVGWRGSSSLRVHADRDESVHILRLLGDDLSKFDVNKYARAREANKVSPTMEMPAPLEPPAPLNALNISSVVDEA